MAALLAIARHLRARPTPPHNTVRFGFFNAEESGLVGSRAYAASLKAARAPVIGRRLRRHDRLQQRRPAHVGGPRRLTRTRACATSACRSRRSSRDAAETLGELPPAQLYTGTTPTGGTDPARFDGAINRSDHAAFHEQGYPAVLVSEDFFPNRPGDPDPGGDPNPNYHSNSDIEIDGRYAADITRAISLAVIELAARPGDASCCELDARARGAPGARTRSEPMNGPMPPSTATATARRRSITRRRSAAMQASDIAIQPRPWAMPKIASKPARPGHEPDDEQHGVDRRVRERRPLQAPEGQQAVIACARAASPSAAAARRPRAGQSATSAGHQA